MPGISAVELRIDGQVVGVSQWSCAGETCDFSLPPLWFNTSALPAGGHVVTVVIRPPKGGPHIRSWSIDVNPTRTTFYLEPSAPLADVRRAVASAGANWIELHHSGTEEGGLVLGNEDPADAINSYVAWYAAQVGGATNPPITEFTVGGSVSASALGALATKVYRREVVDPITNQGDTVPDYVENDPAYPDALMAQDLAAESQPCDPRECEGPGGSAALIAADPPGAQFAPLYGGVTTRTDPLHPRYRGIAHTLTFPREAVGDVDGDGDKDESPFERADALDHGYEHDFKLEDLTPDTGKHPFCLDEKENFWAQRKGYAWSTNLPKDAHPYFDENVGDNCRYLDFTVGLEYPLQLAPGKKYLINIRTLAGDRPSSRYRLRSVKTFRFCPGDPRYCSADTGGGAEGQRLAGPKDGVETEECRRWRKGYNSRKC